MSDKPIGDIVPRSLHGPLRPLWERWKRRPHTLRRVEVDRPVFVVGHPRSGTSWFYKLFTVHPEFAGAPESHLFDHYLRPFLDEDPFRPWGGIDEWVGAQNRIGLLRGLTDEVFARRLDSERKKRIVEKTPEHAHHIPEIRSLYPRAQFVHIVRDGRDVMLSVLAYAENLKNPPAGLIEGARQWCATLDAVEAARDEFSADILEIRYEDIVADPAPMIPQLFEFLGERCPNSLVDEILASHPPSLQSIGKWKREFSTADNEGFVAVAGEWLSRKGYESGPRTLEESPPSS